MNTQGLALKLLLENPDLDAYSRLKPKFFSSHFSTIFTSISNFYIKHDRLPTEVELQIDNSRNTKITTSLLALSNLVTDNITFDILVTVLEDEYTQTQTLIKLKRFLEEIPMLSSVDIIDALSLIPIELDEEVNRSDSITIGRELSVFRKVEDHLARFVELGLCRELDSFGGIARQELLILGGRRGYGKSLMCCNIAAYQYQEGNIAPYFSIEMSGEEVNDRIMAILAHVELAGIRDQTLKGPELLKMAATQSMMFIDGMAEFEEYTSMHDYVPMFSKLSKRELVHPLIIVDDRDLKLSTVDLTCTTLKNKYGDMFTMFIVDYINQIRVDGVHEKDKLDWQAQILISTKLKNLTRKLDVAGISPYQVDDTGQARLSKGLLDAVDMALVIEKDESQLNFIVNKTRSLPIEEGHKLRSYMDWRCVSLISDMALPEVIEDESE